MMINNKNKNNLKPKTVASLHYLPYLGGLLYFVTCLVVYTYNLSYCVYFSIPLEYVSFTLSNSIIVSIFYYFALITVVFLSYLIVNIVNKFVLKQKMIVNCIISFFLSNLMIFLFVIMCLALYFHIVLDLAVTDSIYFLLKDSKGKILAILILSFSLLMTLCSNVMILMMTWEVSSIGANKSDICILPNRKVRNYLKPNGLTKLKNNQFPLIEVFVMIIVVLIISILFWVAFMGHDNAKNRKEFYIISDNDNMLNKYVELYGENDKIFLAPCVIASTSIIINNRSITIKANNNITLSEVKVDTVHLTLSPDRTINESNLSKFYKVDE